MKYALVLSLCLFLFSSCKDSAKDNKTSRPKSKSEILYSNYCKGCHGKEGDLMFSGAANLKISTLNDVETILLIKDGNNKMPAYKKFLSEEDIIQLANYVKGLRNN